MKQYYLLIPVFAFLLFTQDVFVRNIPAHRNAKQRTQNIFVEYDAAHDILNFSDSLHPKSVPSDKYSKEAHWGDMIMWHWKGAHKNLKFISATPKDEKQDPFAKTMATGDILKIKLKPDGVLPDGDYPYDISISINGKPHPPFDPTLQIHR